jgi:hypothetical protein
MRQQRAATIELPPVELEAVRAAGDTGLEVARVLAAGFRERVAQADAAQRLAKEEALLIFVGAQPDDIEHGQMVLRNLAD